MELHQVHPVGPQPSEAAVNAQAQSLRVPVRAGQARSVAALGEQVEVFAPVPHGLADQLLAARVALRRVDDVQPGIQRTPQQPLDRRERGILVADLRAAEAQRADLQPRPPQLSSFHRKPPSFALITENLYPGKDVRPPLTLSSAETRDRRGDHQDAADSEGDEARFRAAAV